jgi:hypothetical protein
VAAAILNRMRAKGSTAFVAAPIDAVTSSNGVTVRRQRALEFTAKAGAVILGSGVKTREMADESENATRTESN